MTARGATCAFVVVASLIIEVDHARAQTPPAPLLYAPPVSPGKTIYVEVQADDPNVRIDRVIARGETTPVCQAPCRQPLQRDDLYVIQGDGVRRTSQFQLPSIDPAVKFTVHAGSATQARVGGILAAVGAVPAGVGYFLWASSLKTPNSPGGSETQTHVGAAMLGAGLVTCIVGALMWAGSDTTVHSSTGATFSQDAPPPARKRPAFALTPRGLVF